MNYLALALAAASFVPLAPAQTLPWTIESTSVSVGPGNTLHTEHARPVAPNGTQTLTGTQVILNPSVIDLHQCGAYPHDGILGPTRRLGDSLHE